MPVNKLVIYNKLKRTDIIDWIIRLLTIVQLTLFVIDSILPFSTVLFILVLSANIFFMFLRMDGVISLRFPKMFLFYGVFALFCYLSSQWAVASASVSKRMSMSIIKMIVTSYMYYYYYSQQEDGVDKLLKAIMYAGYAIVITSFVIYGPSRIIEMSKSSDRIDNEFVNANAMGLLSAQSIAIMVFYTKKEGVSVKMLLAIPALVIIAVSGSKKTVILLMGIFLVSATMNVIWQGKHFGKFFILFLKCVAGILVFYFVLQLPVFNILKTRVDAYITQLMGGQRNSSDDVREKMIYFGIELFKDNPIKGIGIDNAKMVNPYLQAYLHNNFVELLADTGIIGTVLYYLLYAVAIIDIIRKKGHDDLDSIVFSILMCYLVLDYGMVTYYNRMQFFYFMLYYINNERRQSISIVPPM